MIPIGSIINAGSAVWDQLKEQAKAWAKKVVTLYNTPVPPELAKDKETLLSFAKTIKTTVEKIYGGMDEFNSIGLSAIPVIIPVALIATAGGMITKWTLDYNTFKAKLLEYQKMVASGVPPDQAAKTVDMISKNNSAGTGLMDALKYVPLAVIAFIGFKMFSDRR